MSETTDAGTIQNTGTTSSFLTDGLPTGDASTTQPEGQGATTQDGAAKAVDEGTKTEPDGAAPKTETDAKDPVVPEAYDLKMPDGVELDAKLMESVTPLFKELKVTNEAAQKIADVFAAHKQAEAQASIQAFQDTLADWNKQITSDPEFGGKNYEATKKAAQAVIARYGDEQLRQDLNQYGVGNLPSLIRAFARAGRAMAEDTMKGGGTPHEPTRSEKLAAMYPSMNK